MERIVIGLVVLLLLSGGLWYGYVYTRPVPEAKPIEVKIAATLDDEGRVQITSLPTASPIGSAASNKSSNSSVKSSSSTQSAAGSAAPQSSTIASASTPAPTVVSAETVYAAIESSVKTKSYANLTPYLADTVDMTKYGSECCGRIGKDKVLTEITYLSSAKGSWNFNQNDPTIVYVKNEYGYLIGQGYIGLAEDMGVLFSLSTNKKINKIVIVPNYKSLLK